MGTITAANSIYILSVSGLGIGPIQLQGYAADAAFETGEVETAEVVMGVDAIMSAGWIPQINDQTISLQADSASAILFEQWDAAEQAAQEKFQAAASVALPSTGRKYDLQNGVLRRVVRIPGAKKVLSARNFVIAWGSITPAPF